MSSVTFPCVERGSGGKQLSLLVLAGATLALGFALAGGSNALADVIAPLTGHLIGIGLAAGVSLLIRRWAVAILGVGLSLTVALHAWLGLAVCCSATAPPAPGGLTRVAHAPGRLVVLALNTWHVHGDARQLEHYLASGPADVVTLSEFGPDKRAALDNLKAVYPYQIDCADRWPCSLALLSRIPFERAGVSRIPGGEAGRMPYFVWAKFGALGTVVGTHLHRPSRNPWLHAEQMAALTQLARHIDGPLVLAGDLNTSPWSSAFRRLRTDASLLPASVLTPTWPAWPVALPQVALDHVLVSPELAVVAAGTGPAVGSDHLPVWALIERRPIAPEREEPPTRRLASNLAAPRAHLGGEFLGDLGGEHLGAGHLRR